MNDIIFFCDCGIGFFEFFVVFDVFFLKLSVYEFDSLGLFFVSVFVFLSFVVSGFGVIFVFVLDFVLFLFVDYVVVSFVDVL